MKAIDITGRVFGNWTALHAVEHVKGRAIKWMCQCVCGLRKEVSKSALLCGNSKSCGCSMPTKYGTVSRRHGMYRTRTYNSWERMKQRCLDPNCEKYPTYGGRGISVCERWLDFLLFFQDMGEVPEGHTLERKDVNGNYEPGNCIWADTDTQANNKRGMKKYLVDGEWRSLPQLARYWVTSKWQANKRVGQYEMKIIGAENE